MAKIENHQYSIEEAFMQCFYIVPDYQREYVWKEKEVHQLLEDIGDEFNSSSNQQYFIGTILVSPTPEKNHYEIIDGQQRLTTFYLLLCAMKTLIKDPPLKKHIDGLISASYLKSDGNLEENLKLDPRYENASELFSKIVEINSDPDTTKNAIRKSQIKTFGSLENLLDAYDTIYRYLNDYYPEQIDLKKFLGYLNTNVVFIQISTDVSGALKIFETINERGIGLNPMDLLKNLLFTQVKPDEFTKLKDQWKKITRQLELHGEKPLRFLRYFLMANYKIENARNDNTVREDEIYGWFINKKNMALCDYQNKPFEFVQKLITNADKFIEFSTGKGNDGQQNIYMDNLRSLCGGAFSLHYVLLLAAKNFPKPLFDHFVQQLESFLFYYIFTKTATKELERNFSIWADELRDIADESDDVKQAAKYNKFLQDRFTINLKSKNAELSDYLKRYTLNSMQQYRTRYLLAKLTQFVDMAYTGTKTLMPLGAYTVLEIEHILPNNPGAALRSDFTNKNPGKEYDEYKTRLGNLTLLEKPINIVASNDFYAKKCLEYLKCKHYLTSSIVQINTVGNNSSINRINQRLKSFNDWTADSIDERQGLLAELVKDVWVIKDYV